MIKTVLDDNPDGFYNIPDSVYFDAEGLSNSSMGLILKSYAHYLNKDSFKPTPAMQLGTLVHLLVLEPHLFKTSVAVFEKVDMRTKAGKEYKKQFDEEHKGKLIISPDDYKKASLMAENVLANPDASKLLEFTEREVAAFKTVNGVLCKAKADIFASGQYVADLKTTKSASQSRGGFEKSILDFSYHRQAAHYMNMFDVSEFHFIAVENVEPYLVSVFTLSPDYIAAGQRQVNDAIKKFKELHGKDLSKMNLGYPTGVKVVECPYFLAQRPESNEI